MKVAGAVFRVRNIAPPPVASVLLISFCAQERKREGLRASLGPREKIMRGWASRVLSLWSSTVGQRNVCAGKGKLYLDPAP